MASLEHVTPPNSPSEQATLPTSHTTGVGAERGGGRAGKGEWWPLYTGCSHYHPLDGHNDNDDEVKKKDESGPVLVREVSLNGTLAARVERVFKATPAYQDFSDILLPYKCLGDIILPP